MEKILSHTRIIQKKFHAEHASSNDDFEIDIVCFNFDGECVATRADVEPTLKKSKILYY